MENTISPNNGIQNKPKRPVILILLIVILIGAIAVMAVMYYNLKMDSEKKEEILIEQKDNLEGELESMYADYDSLRTKNDSINIKLEAEQNKIQRLLSINASNYQKIKLYEKELKTLRKIMRSYIVQIDSLNQRNKMLVQENVEVRSQLKKVEDSARQLTSEKDELTNKVERASVLAAKDIVAIPLNQRSKERDKASKVVKIRTCFTLRENPIIPAGPVGIYKRIINPNGVVLVNDPTYIMDYQGKKIAFSDSREITYENQDVDVCIYWNVAEELMEGEYNVELYSKGELIGTTSFTLK